ncbi:hypothetical protein [Halomonas sp. H5]|uniref:hypothetical protein n=1 Tax=Halomonas sp. H5 TaxID=3423910 RepID=UPI003D36E717
MSTTSTNLAEAITQRAARRQELEHRLSSLDGLDTGERLQQAQSAQRDALEKLWRSFAPESRWGNPPEAGEIRAAAESRTPRGPDRDGIDRDAYFSMCRDHLCQADAQVAGLTEELETEAEERSALEAERREIEGQGHGVPATREGLSTLAEAIAGQRAELRKVRQTIDRLSEDNGDPGSGETGELEAAQCRVDELAAAAMLGDVDEAEQRAAATALAKARQRAAPPLEARKNSAAARRGLERKAEELSEGVEHLEQARRELAAEVYESEWKEAERRLVELLEGEELAGIMRQFRDSREAYSRAYCAAYGAAPTIVGESHLKVEGPLLTHHKLRWPLRV